MLIIYQEDKNYQFIKLEGLNVIIKIQGDQNHEFDKLGYQNYNLTHLKIKKLKKIYAKKNKFCVLNAS